MRHTTLLRNTNEYCHRALRDENRPSKDDAGTAERSERAPTRDQQSMSPLPLVGRDAERAKLDVLLASSTAHGLTLLTGEVIRPYGIWIDALRDVAMDALEPLDQHLAPFIRPATVGTPQIQRDEGSRERFFNAVVTLLGRLCVDHRLAFVLDDLQWLDKSSGALLHFVRRRLDPELPVVFAAGARPAEMEDNRFARVLLQSLARDGRLTRVPLQPLSANEVGALIRAAGSDIRVEQALRDSGGNPLYVLELTRAKQMDREASTCTVDTLMADRLAPLDAPTRDLLSFAASIGHAFAPEQLAQLLDRPLPDILSSIVELQRRGILAEATSTEFDFAHDLVRQTVYRTLSQPHRRAIHHQIARQLLAASVHDPQLHGEVVHHAMLAGDSRMTARACVEASHHCLRAFCGHGGARCRGTRPGSRPFITAGERTGPARNPVTHCAARCRREFGRRLCGVDGA
ncbi:ATP-binding protein [Paraburkholderia podalyriae]|nr:AAA family ATPase [Paraburkholderia podalyriae]